MKKCPFCGAEIIYEYAPCPGCGYAGQGSWAECPDEGTEKLQKMPPRVPRAVPNLENAADPPKRTLRDKMVSPLGHLIVLILSIFSWPLGIGLGIWLSLSNNEEHRKIGRRAFIYTLASFLAYTVFLYLMVAISGHGGHMH